MLFVLPKMVKTLVHGVALAGAGEHARPRQRRTPPHRGPLRELGSDAPNRY